MDQLIGRSEEWQQLLQAYERTKHSGAKPPRPCQEFILIRGQAGTGKTALASSLLSTVRNDAGYFLVGKFDLTCRQVPFAAFVSQFNQLTEAILGGGELPQLQAFRVSFIRKAIQVAVGNEGRVLIDVMPSLERLMGPQQDPVEGQEAALHRFPVVFCKFCRAISAIVPLVFFFDDLQWSDNASLDVIQTLIQSPLDAAAYSNSSLLLIGAYRDEGMSCESQSSNTESVYGSEVITAAFCGQSLNISLHSAHSTAGALPELPLSPHLRLWLNLASQGSLCLTEISLSNLDEISQNELIAAFLELSFDSTAALGSTIFSKSEGNPF
jgi:predicted ATPase